MPPRAKRLFAAVTGPLPHLMQVASYSQNV
jgi:hypothetical protein